GPSWPLPAPGPSRPLSAPGPANAGGHCRSPRSNVDFCSDGLRLWRGVVCLGVPRGGAGRRGWQAVRCPDPPQAAGGSGWWQATGCPGAISRISGRSVAQISVARGQRVRNRQPDGGSSGEGSSELVASTGGPPSVSANVPPSVGAEEMSSIVYGWAGARYRSDVSGTSHTVHRYITATRSAMLCTTDRSCEMNTMVSPYCAFISSSRLRICACTETSSADTGSSHTG